MAANIPKITFLPNGDWIERIMSGDWWAGSRDLNKDSDWSMSLCCYGNQDGGKTFQTQQFISNMGNFNGA